MKKISKTKKVKSKVNAKKKVTTVKQYESHYLAIALLAVLLIEGFLFTSTSVADWQKGLAVLDVSSVVVQTVSDTNLVLAPVTDTISGVNEFYQLAATEMMQILDMSQESPIEEISLVAGGVSDFYEQASIQLAELLDFSSVSSWPAQVAGVSISAY